MPLPEEPEKEFSWEFVKTDTVKNKDGVCELWWNRNHASKGGSTPGPVWWSMDFEETPKP